MLVLVLGYFVQSFLEIRKLQPVRVAIERIGESRTGEPAGPIQGGSAAGDRRRGRCRDIETQRGRELK